MVHRRDPGSAAWLVDAGVAEHLYETLRDRANEPIRGLARANRRDCEALHNPQHGADRSETTLAALRCLRAVAEACPTGVFARRFVSGADPTATTLRDAVDSDDAKIQTAVAAFVRIAANDDDPGNVPADATVRLMMLLAEVYERAPATVHIHTESDGDDPRMEARGALVGVRPWESPGRTLARWSGAKRSAPWRRIWRGIFARWWTTPRPRGRGTRHRRRFPGSCAKCSSDHARPAELRSVVDVLRARDVPGLFVDALRRVDGLNPADPTAERNAVECICATAAVLGVVLGDDDEWDEKGDVVGEVEVENPRKRPAERRFGSRRRL